jgi:hypothetical protein
MHYKCHNSDYPTESSLLHLWSLFYETLRSQTFYAFVLLILKNHQRIAGKAGGPALIGVLPILPGGEGWGQHDLHCVGRCKGHAAYCFAEAAQLRATPLLRRTYSSL